MAAMDLIRLICVGLMVVVVKGQTDCGNCNATSDTPGCSNRAIEKCVCEVDAYCCTNGWDDICIARILSDCKIDCSGLGHCPYEMDGNLEVLFPPLIDEDETHLDFKGSSTFMKVTIIVPKQYSTAKFDFDGASNPAGGYDSTINTFNNPYWVVDALTDPCNTKYHGYIPWIDFRTSLGGVKEKRFHDAVYYDTAINIEVTKNLTLNPHTLLLEKEGATLMDDHHAQEHVRYVRNKIPFEVHFDLELKLWGDAKVRSPHLRVSAAVTDSSVLNVDTNLNPVVSKAQLIFVTLIPSPLMLTAPTIAVDVPALANYLTIEEIVPYRNCSESQAICTQHWQVKIAPEQCTLNGQYIANMTGICLPNAENCYGPTPNFAEIVMDITSDDFCGITQQVEIQGTLVIEDTDCNTYLKGYIEVNSPQGAAINHTEITKVVVAPTLKGSNYLTIYEKPSKILQYYAELTNPHKVHFQFLWSGKELRCDIIASIDVVAKVEYEATRSLQILSLDANLGTKLEAKMPNKRKRNILQQRETFDDYEMRMLAHGAITDVNGVGISPDDASNVGDATGSGAGGVSTTSASSMAMATSIAVVVLAAVIVSICCIGGVLFVRARRQKSAVSHSPAAAAVGMSPRNKQHKRTISQAVMAMRAVNGNDQERTPLHTPDARGGQQFFHDE